LAIGAANVTAKINPDGPAEPTLWNRVVSRSHKISRFSFAVGFLLVYKEEERGEKMKIKVHVRAGNPAAKGR